MTAAEELKSLIKIRDVFSGQLTNEDVQEETKQQLRELVQSLTDRIYLILDTVITENAALKDSNAKQLQDTKSKWFSDVSKSILRILVAREIAERIDVGAVVKIFSSWT